MKVGLTMIELIATAESVQQGRELLKAGINTLVIGESRYGLRIPGNFNFDEMAELIQEAHHVGKRVIVAANAILHNDKIKTAREFLRKIKELNVDELFVGDTGLIQLLKTPELYTPFTYDASVLLTSPGQVNFWKKYGAVSALVAREVPFVELKPMSAQSELPLTVQVYGACCIHQSGRPLIQNYFNFIEKHDTNAFKRHLFLSEPNKPDTHYSIYSDEHGTHIFANHDLNLIEQLPLLHEHHLTKWYLDGIYTTGQAFVEIAKVFADARDAIEQGTWSDDLAITFNQRVHQSHPLNRELDTGFFLYDANKVT